MPIATGSSNLFLSRDTECYLEQPVTSAPSLTPTAMAIAGGTLTITATHSYSVGDLVKISGSNIEALNTVHKVASVSTTVSFTVSASTITGTITPVSAVRVQKVNLWKIPILPGFSFSQQTNTSEVTLSEMQTAGGVSRRGKAKFNDSYAPAEWSFETYVQPIVVSNAHRLADEPLFVGLAAAATYSGSTWSGTSTVLGSSQSSVNFGESNKAILSTFTLYFVVGGAKAAADKAFLADGDTVIYKIEKCVVNSADFTFDVEGLAKTAWAGFGSLLSEVAMLNASTALNVVSGDTKNFIRNKLTAVALSGSVSGSNKNYSITLTGGSLNINNNITFITPETLGLVNQPLGHVTGTRSVSGTLTCYLDELSNGSKDLLNDLISATTAVTNSFVVDLYVGGKDVSDAPIGPGLQFKMGQVSFDIPAIQVEDVYSIEANFTALPSSISSADEITKIAFVGS